MASIWSRWKRERLLVERCQKLVGHHNPGVKVGVGEYLGCLVVLGSLRREQNIEAFDISESVFVAEV